MALFYVAPPCRPILFPPALLAGDRSSLWKLCSTVAGSTFQKKKKNPKTQTQQSPDRRPAPDTFDRSTSVMKSLWEDGSYTEELLMCYRDWCRRLDENTSSQRNIELVYYYLGDPHHGHTRKKRYQVMVHFSELRRWESKLPNAGISIYISWKQTFSSTCNLPCMLPIGE